MADAGRKNASCTMQRGEGEVKKTWTETWRVGSRSCEPASQLWRYQPTPSFSCRSFFNDGGCSFFIGCSFLLGTSFSSICMVIFCTATTNGELDAAYDVTPTVRRSSSGWRDGIISLGDFGRARTPVGYMDWIVRWLRWSCCCIIPRRLLICRSFSHRSVLLHFKLQILKFSNYGTNLKRRSLFLLKNSGIYYAF